MKKRAPKKAAKKSGARAAAPRLGEKLRLLYSEAEIQQHVGALARKLNADYQGKTLHVVGILENCFVFMADLVRRLSVPAFCHFVKAEVHDREAGRATVREIMFTPRVDATNRDILLVEGILQSGVTLDHLYRTMLSQGANTVRTATLVEKIDERKVDVPTDYVLFKSEGRYLVGYGLGFQDQYRNLPCIAMLTNGIQPVPGSH